MSNPPFPSHLSVGQLYHPSRTRWPEGSHFNYQSGGYELLLTLSHPTPKEISAITNGESHFALTINEGIIFICSQFHNPNSHHISVEYDAPYTWHLVPIEERTLPPAETPETRALLHIILIDADTGLIHALRAVTLSPAFTKRLHDAIRAQAANGWAGQAAYDTALARIYARHPRVHHLVDIADIRCKGGD